MFDYGLPLFRGKPADVPRTNFYGFSDDRLQEYTTTFTTATFDHRFPLICRYAIPFATAITARLSHPFVRRRDGYWPDFNGSAESALRLGTQENSITKLISSGKLRYAGMQKHVLFGTEFGWEDFDFRSKNSTDIPSISIFDPVQT